jgi:hypothetical protein
MKSLDQEELDAAEVLAEKWNKEGAPPDLQKKCVIVHEWV